MRCPFALAIRQRRRTNCWECKCAGVARKWELQIRRRTRVVRMQISRRRKSV